MHFIRLVVAAILVLTTLGRPVEAAGPPTVHFQIFARTDLRLADIVWTGQHFLYVENTTSRIVAAGPAGLPVAPFALMPRQVEETRCRVSPGSHGFVAGALYCHSPDNRIYRISPDAKTVTVIATLPHVARSDGALGFDTVGRLGFALIAASGRSGSGKVRGGTVFAITAAGAVRPIGQYANAGGADELAIAPADFGSAAGQVLLAVDAGKSGALVAMDAHGVTSTLATLPDGPNPIVVLAADKTPRAGSARAGLYVTDTLSRDVYFASAAELAPYAGSVMVGGELTGQFWAVRPGSSGFMVQKLQTTLRDRHYNLEGAAYIAS